MAVSKIIRSRLRDADAPYLANDCIAEHLRYGDREALTEEVAGIVDQLLDALVIDTEHDHNTRETAGRVARMLVNEVFAGRYTAKPRVTDFPNASRLDQLYVVGPVDVRSACSHHLVPILGRAWVGIIPGERVIGLSKFARLAQWVMARPQIQEEATVQLADEIEAACQPTGLGVVVKARHLCCAWRGVKDGSEMTTSVMRGVMRDDPAARAELMSIVAGQGFSR